MFRRNAGPSNSIKCSFQQPLESGKSLMCRPLVVWYIANTSQSFSDTIEAEFMHDASDKRHPIHNRLLSMLPPDEFAVIRPHLKEVSYEPVTMLARAGDAMRACFFPNSGMVSLLCVTEQGRSIEAGFIGLEGMVGVP